MQFIPQPVDDYPFVALVFCPDGQVLTIPCTNITEDGMGNRVILDYRGNAQAIIGEGILFVMLESSLIDDGEEELPDPELDENLLDRNYL